MPDIIAEKWESDLAQYLGDEFVGELRRQIERGEEPAGIRCTGRCGQDILPWHGDDIFVHTYHLEEHYGIDLETPGRVNPSKDLRQQVIRLYDGVCFNCGGTVGLHIDHVRPRSKGGDAAFRNLQPLCEKCGNTKADAEPEEVTVYSTTYFMAPPSDVFEGLFW